MAYRTGILEAGCDEVGRGCLAGPVVAAVVILPPGEERKLMKESKGLTPKQRIQLDAIIRAEAMDWAIGYASPREIDAINVLQASHLAMHRAIAKLTLKPTMLLIDGLHFKPYAGMEHACIVKGDTKVDAIAAASILAKVHRDNYMKEIAEENPGYEWEKNMGYPTLFHRQALLKLGTTAYHRRSFAPVLAATQLKLWN